MKKLIPPFVQFSLKDNAIYLIFLALLIAATIALYIYGGRTLLDSQAQIKQLQGQVQDLETKKAILSSSAGETPAALAEDAQLMGRLIPESEDYFSIIAALDKLSQQTGFLVTSYTINLQGSTTNKLALTISGVGDTNAFIAFLQNYTFEGERLITIENITLNEKDNQTFGLSLNFYNSKTSATSTELNYQKSLAQVNDIKSKINFSLQNEQVASDESYQTKQNPF